MIGQNIGSGKPLTCFEAKSALQQAYTIRDQEYSDKFRQNHHIAPRLGLYGVQMRQVKSIIEH